MVTRNRSQAALALSTMSTRAVEDAMRRLDDAIEACSDGVPIRPLDDEDSLAVSMETARDDTNILMESSRSRRSLRAKTGG